MSNDITAVGLRTVQAAAPESAQPRVQANLSPAATTKAVAPSANAQESKSRADAKPQRVKDEPKVQFDSEEMMKRLQDAIARLNEQVQKNGRGLDFSLDEELNRHIITVRNTSSGEVVRQIPTDVAIKVAHSIEDVKGLLLDEHG